MVAAHILVPDRSLLLDSYPDNTFNIINFTVLSTTDPYMSVFFDKVDSSAYYNVHDEYPGTVDLRQPFEESIW